MRSCNDGELCVVFACRSRSSCNLFLFYVFYLRCALNLLCLDLRVTFFSAVPCTAHSDLAYAACSYSSGWFLTVLVLSFFCIFFYVFLFVILLLCQYSVVSLYVVCVVSILFLCFGWCPCILEKRSITQTMTELHNTLTRQVTSCISSGISNSHRPYDHRLLGLPQPSTVAMQI